MNDEMVMTGIDRPPVITAEQIDAARLAGACDATMRRVSPGMPWSALTQDEMFWAERHIGDVLPRVSVPLWTLSGHGDGYGFGSGFGSGNGYGGGFGHGYVDGSGSGYGYGDGSVDWDEDEDEDDA